MLSAESLTNVILKHLIRLLLYLTYCCECNVYLSQDPSFRVIVELHCQGLDKRIGEGSTEYISLPTAIQTKNPPQTMQSVLTP
jgi:hypothetical protein